MKFKNINFIFGQCKFGDMPLYISKWTSFILELDRTTHMVTEGTELAALLP